jgi:glycosyltransferase involved in cell wall biosynthesis
MFEAMGMGVPILHGVKGESAEIIERHNAGLLFSPELPNELIDAAQRLMKDASLHARLKRNALKAARTYDRADQASRMIDCLQGVLRRDG